MNMSIVQNLRRLLRRLTPAEVASSELAQAELARLEAQTAQEYSAAMVSYQDARIKRLKAFLRTQGDAP